MNVELVTKVRALMASGLDPEMAASLIVDVVTADYARQAAVEQERQRTEWRERKKRKQSMDTVPESSPGSSPGSSSSPQKKEDLISDPDQEKKEDPDQDPDSFCSELPDSVPILEFPVVGKGPKSWPLTQRLVDELGKAFPGLDVIAEMRKALAWLQTNPMKRKTASGMPRFLNGWVSRAQNSRAGARASPNGTRDIRVGWVGVEPGKQYPVGDQEL